MEVDGFFELSYLLSVPGSEDGESMRAISDSVEGKLCVFPTSMAQSVVSETLLTWVDGVLGILESLVVSSELIGISQVHVLSHVGLEVGKEVTVASVDST